MAKKLLIIGFIVVLLIGIPATIYLVQTQTKTQQNAAASTTLTFSPPTTTVTVGQTFPLDIVVNPTNNNQVSFVKMFLTYDNTKLATTAAGIVSSNAFPTKIEGPVYQPCTGTSCTIAFTISIGADPTKAVLTQTTAATIAFQALTVGTTQVTYGSASQILSISSTDQQQENVLSTTSPANITIIDNGGTPTATPSAVPTTAITPTGTITPTVSQTPTATATPSPTTVVTAQSPVCSSLTANITSGTTPFAVTFTAIGTSNTSTISKVTFNFGDGNAQDVTTGGGIGTSSINVQQNYTYNTGGNFTATATLTDAGGNVSAVCSQAISVTGNATTPTLTPTPTPTITQVAQPQPTVAATGPSSIVMGAGIVGIIGAIAGAFLFFGL